MCHNKAVISTLVGLKASKLFCQDFQLIHIKLGINDFSAFTISVQAI